MHTAYYMGHTEHSLGDGLIRSRLDLAVIYGAPTGIFGGLFVMRWFSRISWIRGIIRFGKTSATVKLAIAEENKYAHCFAGSLLVPKTLKIFRSDEN